MIRKKYLFLILSFFGIRVFSQSFDSLCMQQHLVIACMQKNHISPPEFTTETNLEILDLFIEEIDARNIFFFQNDRENMQNSVTNGNSEDSYCRVIFHTFELIRKRVTQIDSLLNIIESKPIVFSEKDTLTFLAKNEKRKFWKNLQELRLRVEKRIKYDCLNTILKPLKENEDFSKLTPADITARLATAKKKAIFRYRKFLDDYRKEFTLKHKIADAMSNSIALRCDPHSSYFNVYEKESWDEGLSKEELSFGFYSSENENGEVSISELVPGGPAWKSNELHEGDVLLSFQFEDEQPVELAGADIEDYYIAFHGSMSRNVELTVRSKDNQVNKIKLQKAKIQSQENVLNSYVLTDGSKRFGYIPIPSFYSDDEAEEKQGVANDVAKEVIKLQQDTIEGLILDLRYNGGGSMQEAMGLAGIFIDEGPLAVYKTRAAKPQLLKDLNRGSIYDGPLLVLINGASASASEFLTASLQDYNRAIIAGTTTYGKGSAQNVIPIDTDLIALTKAVLYENPALTTGYLKVTKGKFYRVTTISHQGKGIVPDVHIPDMIEKLYEKESEEKFFLPADSVNKKVVYNLLPPLPISELREKSKKRIDADKQFKDMVFLADSVIKANEKTDKVVLTIKEYKKYYDREENLTARIKDVLDMETEEGFWVKNNSLNEQVGNFDEYQKKINEVAIERLKNDLILHEAYSILRDMIKLK
ncbi:MAG: carboxy terminal-processing peptidase [Bacteroidia bacterium]|nr:carboxy terminal-processing peptidase [Bacteroidia bacterium]